MRVCVCANMSMCLADETGSTNVISPTRDFQHGIVHTNRRISLRCVCVQCVDSAHTIYIIYYVNVDVTLLHN